MNNCIHYILFARAFAGAKRCDLSKHLSNATRGNGRAWLPQLDVELHRAIGNATSSMTAATLSMGAVSKHGVSQVKRQGAATTGRAHIFQKSGQGCKSKIGCTASTAW